MEFHNCNGETIVGDALLSYVLDHCCDTGIPWVRFERRGVDRAAMLKLLAALVRTTKTSWHNAARTVQIAALRLAWLDVEQVMTFASPSEKMSYACQRFDLNMEVFHKSWKLDSPIPEHLRTSTLHSLHVSELHRLRGILTFGWREEITSGFGSELFNSAAVWVTPAHRPGKST